jgi:DNA repair protein RadD
LGGCILKPRYYQSEAVAAIWNHIRTNDDHALAVLPTGSGKSYILSQLAKDVIAWNGRICILSHVKELIGQVAEHIHAVAPEIPLGIYSAGLKSRDLGYPVTVAGIQSAVNAAEAFGPVDVICIDEVHRVPEDGDGQYLTFLETAKKLNPNVRLIGLTATPFRTSSGMICGPGKLFSRICYSIGVRELIVKDYLSPLKSKSTIEKTDLSKVHVRGGEFIQGELEKTMMSDDGLVVRACLEICQRTEQRKSVLVFATGVEHAKMIAQFLRDIEGDEKVGMVFGETSSDERTAAIKAFREGGIKYLVNVDVLTTGFDAPNVDGIAVLRPTMSAGLWAQMCGRGLRIAPGKTDCLILDYGGNLIRHGPIDRMVIEEHGKAAPADPWKECPACLEVVPRTCEVCPDCGTKFEKKTREARGHDDTASDRDALSGPETIAEIDYQVHEKRKDNGISRTLRVNYYCGLMHTPADFVCLEHVGFARQKAVAWWKARSSEPVPATIEEALKVIKEKGLKEPKQIVFRSEGPYLKAERYIDLTHNPSPHIVVVDRRIPADDKAFTNIPF